MTQITNITQKYKNLIIIIIIIIIIINPSFTFCFLLTYPFHTLHILSPDSIITNVHTFLSLGYSFLLVAADSWTSRIRSQNVTHSAVGRQKRYNPLDLQFQTSLTLRGPQDLTAP